MLCGKYYSILSFLSHLDALYLSKNIIYTDSCTSNLSIIIFCEIIWRSTCIFVTIMSHQKDQKFYAKIGKNCSILNALYLNKNIIYTDSCNSYLATIIFCEIILAINMYFCDHYESPETSKILCQNWWKLFDFVLKYEVKVDLDYNFNTE